MINVQIIKQRANSYFSAKQVSDNGRLNAKTIALKFPDHFGDTIQPASVYSIEGEVENRTYEVNSFTVNEDFIEVTEAKMLKPGTRLIEAWLMKNIDGVGQVKAGKFARHPNFETMVISNDFDALRSLTNNEEVAAQILKKFPRDELLEAVNWLASKKLPTKVVVRLVDIWKERTLEQIQQNPFCLMQFDVSYKKCLELALECGFEETDDICQSALIVDIVNQYSGRSGSTGAPLSAIKQLSSARNVSDTSSALRASGRLSQAGLVNNIVQTEGNFLIEYEVATKLKAALNRGDGEGSLLAGWETDLRPNEIKHALNEFEKSIPFSLTNDQKAVVTGSLRNKVCCLSGGAGTGKTTILKAILEVTDKVAHGIEKQLLALSGKAAQRMTEVTGIQASTIAKFCINFKTKKPPDHMLVVLDEASMIDVYSMHKLLMILPSTCRLIFVGDVEQLPPVGGGLVFHSLMKSDFPKFELKKVQRQSSDSKIHKFATSIRNEEPNINLDNYFSDPESECSFLNTDDASWIKQTYFELGGIENTVVLCPTQRGKGGVREVNNAIQRAIGLDRKTIRYVDKEYGIQDYVNSQGNRFHLNDLVLIAKNSYDADVRNGDIGKITEVNEQPTEEGACGVLEINGRSLWITEDLLAKMSLGYAVTIHKSQGSEWQNVMVVLNKAGASMMDKAMLYTAATRAKQKLVICSNNETSIADAVIRGSLALNRNVNLDHFLIL